TASVASTAVSSVNRVVGRVDGTGAADTSTALTDGYNLGNIRSAISTDGINIWTSGTAASTASPTPTPTPSGGVRFTTFGSTTSTQVSTTVINTRQINIFLGQLYVSSASGSIRVATVGSGTPMTSGQTITNLTGFPTSGS